MVVFNVYRTKKELGRAAAQKAADLFEEFFKKKGKARFIVATGASQFEFLNALCKAPDIKWEKTEMFHLDEYIGLPEHHNASFRKYLKERLVNKVHPGKVHFIKGDARDPEKECDRMNWIISQEGIDIAFVGIGENGHLAFNDPPADFEIENPYIIVDLDQKCRQQQVGEGWFRSIEEVPDQAISMSIKQILKSKKVICVVPDKRKAEAVRNCLSANTPISPMHPASILKTHPHTRVFLDEESSSLL